MCVPDSGADTVLGALVKASVAVRQGAGLLPALRRSATDDAEFAVAVDLIWREMPVLWRLVCGSRSLSCYRLRWDIADWCAAVRKRRRGAARIERILNRAIYRRAAA